MSIDEIIAGQLQARRKGKGWSIDRLAQQSGVSKAMISKIERQVSSPSAATLGRLAAGLGISLTELITGPESRPHPLRRRTEQPVWRDPEQGYQRRQVSEKGTGQGAELVEITLPAGAAITYPRWEPAPYRQQLWLCEGTLQLTYGETHYELAAGDCLSFGVDAPLTFANPGSQPCRYLLVMTPA